MTKPEVPLAPVTRMVTARGVLFIDVVDKRGTWSGRPLRFRYGWPDRDGRRAGRGTGRRLHRRRVRRERLGW